MALGRAAGSAINYSFREGHEAAHLKAPGLEGAFERRTDRLRFEVFRLRGGRQRGAEPQSVVGQLLVGALRDWAEAALVGQEPAAVKLPQPHHIRQI